MCVKLFRLGNADNDKSKINISISLKFYKVKYIRIKEFRFIFELNTVIRQFNASKNVHYPGMVGVRP